MFRWNAFARRHLIALTTLIATVALAGSVVFSAPPAGSDWRKPPSEDFPLVGANYGNQRYSTLDQITPANVKTLGGAWSLRLEEGLRGGQLGNLDATPVVIDGVMYVTTSMRNVLAIDAKTGSVKWRYRPDGPAVVDRKSTRLNSSHIQKSRMPSSA